MNGTTAILELEQAHADCSCVIVSQISQPTTTELDKDGCKIAVENLIIAFDCDLCGAFSENDTRPDIISIWRCKEKNEWLVLEMKTTMRLHAADQARAALERLGRDLRFQVHLDHADVVFVIGRRRRADNTLMRKIGTITLHGWQIVPRLLPSGGTVKCHRN